MKEKILDELGHKKLLVITGKGGTGKSAIAAGLALKFSQEGKKVWLVELGRKKDFHFSRLHELLGCKILEHKATEIHSNSGTLWASRLDPTECLAEYVGLKIPGGSFAGMLLNNRVTAAFLEVVPGLTDLVALGKLWFHLESEKANPKPDMIIVDGPASGHGVSLLRTPSNFAHLTKQGPIYKDSAAMQTFFTDKEKSAVLFTSLPEEMSLQESWEHYEFLKNFYCPLLFINKLFPKPLDCDAQTASSLIKNSQEYVEQRFLREEKTLKDFQKMHQHWTVFPVPLFFPDPTAPSLAQRIVRTLS